MSLNETIETLRVLLRENTGKKIQVSRGTLVDAVALLKNFREQNERKVQAVDK